MANILIVAAHPDDEVISVGGTSLKHAENGDNVFVLIMCNSRTNENFEMINCSEVLKTKGLYNMKYLDQGLDTIPFHKLVEDISEIISVNKICTIYTHTPKDLNRDHSILAEAVYVAARPTNSSVKIILGFSTPGSYYKETFSPNYFIDIEKTVQAKIKALEMYNSEMQEVPHPRSIQNIIDISKVYGAQNNLKFAEAFEVIRIIL